MTENILKNWRNSAIECATNVILSPVRYVRRKPVRAALNATALIIAAPLAMQKQVPWNIPIVNAILCAYAGAKMIEGAIVEKAIPESPGFYAGVIVFGFAACDFSAGCNNTIRTEASPVTAQETMAKQIVRCDAARTYTASFMAGKRSMWSWAEAELPPLDYTGRQTDCRIVPQRGTYFTMEVTDPLGHKTSKPYLIPAPPQPLPPVPKGYENATELAAPSPQ